MQNKDEVIYENSLAEAMLEVAATSQNAQAVLIKCANVMREKVLVPLQNKLKEYKKNGNPNMSEFWLALKSDPILSDALGYLTTEHSQEGLQRRGLYRLIPVEQIRNDFDALQKLFEHLEENLTQKEMKSLDDVERCTKSITELTFCFVSYFKPELRLAGDEKERYLRIKGTILPSVDEITARVLYQPTKKMALTTGIGRVEGKDIIPSEEKNPKSFEAGKAFFEGVSLARNIPNKIAQFDRIVKILLDEGLLSLNTDKENVSQYVINQKENQVLSEDLQGVVKQFQVLKDLMKSLKVREIPEQRIPNILHTSKTFIENLSQNSNLPMVASVSGTEGKALAALYYLGAFTRDEGEHKSEQPTKRESFDAFDYDTALMFSNVLGALLIYSGHHSYLEVVEPFNRLLDAAGIEASLAGVDGSLYEEKQIRVLLEASSTDDSLTRRLEFIHPQYKEQVKEKTLEIIEEQRAVDNLGASMS